MNTSATFHQLQYVNERRMRQSLALTLTHVAVRVSSKIRVSNISYHFSPALGAWRAPSATVARVVHVFVAARAARAQRTPVLAAAPPRRLWLRRCIHWGRPARGIRSLVGGIGLLKNVNYDGMWQDGLTGSCRSICFGTLQYRLRTRCI